MTGSGRVNKESESPIKPLPKECPDATASAQATLDAERRQNHPRCVVCGETNARGIGLDFAVAADGSVSTVFDCELSWEGYAGVVHGGVVASLLDGAMTNCLFARGITAVTAELTVRFRSLLRIGVPAQVKAWITRTTPHLHILNAEITQSGCVAASARGKFRQSPDLGIQTLETT
jgi:acyl-coenzyme A thioesterase PaaI-like protein